MNRRYFDIVIGSVLITLSIIILTLDGLAEGGAETDLGTMFMPRVVAGFILIFSAMIAIPSLHQIMRSTPLTAQEKINTNGLGGVLIYIAIFVAYWWFLPLVGFIFATPIAMFTIAVLLGGRSWLAMSLVSVILPVVIFYGAREIIRVYLPEWSL